MASGFDQTPCDECCDECGVEITWAPVVIAGRLYCCHDCAVGLECDCAGINPHWEDEGDAEPFWVGGLEGSLESTYDADYSFD